MKIENEKKDDIIIIRVIGRFDANEVALFEQNAAQFIAPEIKKLLLDFSSLDYISSAGLRCVLSAYKLLSSRGGKLSVVGAKGLVNDVLVMSGFVSLIPMFDSMDKAL